MYLTYHLFPFSNLYLSWGLFQVLRGISFLNVDAKLRHGNLHGNAVFVNSAGDWKLFGFENMKSTDMEEDFAPPSVPSLQKYSSPEVSLHDLRK
jgi:SCY1-like protein 1